MTEAVRGPDKIAFLFERTDNTERVYVDAEGIDDEAVKYGFAWLLNWTKHGHSRVAVVVPQVRQIENLGRAIGASRGAALRKDRRLQEAGVAIEAYSFRNLPFGLADVPVLAVWVDDGQLGRLDGLNLAGICAIPWIRDDIQDWKAAWNPRDVRTGKAEITDPLSLNDVVVAALESLTERVNLTTGIGHPSDKDSAIGMFKALRNAGEGYDTAQVRAWAIRHGWQSDDARELADVGAKIQDGKTVRGYGRNMWRNDIVDIWREEAAAKKDGDA